LGCASEDYQSEPPDYRPPKNKVQGEDHEGVFVFSQPGDGGREEVEADRKTG
jgi:hypothetical protein